jgi:hypothetical protein
VSCPLCSSSEASLYDKDMKRSFYLCGSCALVYVSRSDLLSAKDERERYEAHENSSEDAGYVQYLKSIFTSVEPHIKVGDEGLDFGSGKTSVLGDFFPSCDSYDVFFQPREEIWLKRYDFIILSEVIEHLAQPLETMERLSGLLKPGGQFFIKTKFIPDNFSAWFYKRDLTHVQFFSPASMNWLSRRLGMSECLEMGKDLYHFTMR